MFLLQNKHQLVAILDTAIKKVAIWLQRFYFVYVDEVVDDGEDC